MLSNDANTGMVDLKPAHGQHSLLDTLIGLYEKISQQLLNERLTSYHTCLSENIHEDIIEPLAHILDKLTAVKAVNQESGRIRTHYLSSIRPTHTELPTQQSNAIRSSSLSDYFKINNNLFTPHPCISDKLMVCIMDNVHASIRLARQGECDTSKLHMSIARNAMDELSHFLESDRFREFTREVKHITIHVAHYEHRASADNINKR